MNKLNYASSFIMNNLKKSECVSSQEILQKAKRFTIRTRTLKRAKALLGVKSVKLAWNLGWAWIKPGFKPSIPKGANRLKFLLKLIYLNAGFNSMAGINRFLWQDLKILGLLEEFQRDFGVKKLDLMCPKV